MKQNGTLLNTQVPKDDETCTTPKNTIKTPIKKGAFNISNEEKIGVITHHFKEIMDVLGLDLNNDSLKETPKRVAKMYVNEIFSGLNPKNKPEITLFDNEFNYTEPLIEKNIPFTSFCEHHFVPIQGIANVAYIPSNKVIGLSKIHRVVDYFSKRPQVQERLTLQIQNELKTILKTDDVGVVIKASHSCISCRGIDHQGSHTITSFLPKSFKSSTDIMTCLNTFK